MRTSKLILTALMALTAASGYLYADETAAPGKPVAAAADAKEKGKVPSRPPTKVVPGYRGASIALPGDQLLYLKKGDRVDVMVSFDTVTKDAKETVTATILQNVVVINVVKPEAVTGTGAVELLINPNEAQYLALSVAQAKKINLAIRAPGDLELHPMEMASFRRLIK